jgi:hypothetical protein
MFRPARRMRARQGPWSSLSSFIVNNIRVYPRGSLIDCQSYSTGNEELCRKGKTMLEDRGG